MKNISDKVCGEDFEFILQPLSKTHSNSLQTMENISSCELNECPHLSSMACKRQMFMTSMTLTTIC